MAQTEKKAMLQGQDWSGEMGEKWNRHRAQFEGMIAPIGQATLAQAAFRKGERVLDIGCGGGPTTLDIARAVGPDGKVLGIDISPVLVLTAQERAGQAQLHNAHFVCGDAATMRLPPPPYEHLFSRFGVMFFNDPFAAFKNMRQMLDDQGRLTFCCWGPPPENPWVGKLAELVGRHVVLPPPDPTAPGPFAFADQTRTRGILEQAGFRNIEFTPWHGSQLLGGPGLDAVGAAQFAMQAFFVGEVLADQPQAVKEAVLEDIIKLFDSMRTAQGIEMQAMAWLVTATA